MGHPLDKEMLTAKRLFLLPNLKAQSKYPLFGGST